ncbi:cell surface hyaluronidase [Patella vulgata]|uniref:cell surface hyaluronidase n=1 Tax=Patella vulgata TaxID=6465 RepID=UPI0024A7D91F|nr:cell surface hyaluronidase [Patella vulgata]
MLQGSVVSQTDSWKPGMVVYVFDEKTGKSLSGEYFFLGNYEPNLSQIDVSRLVTLLNGIANDRIVAVSVYKNMVHPQVDLTTIFKAIEQLAYGNETNSSPLRKIANGDAYVLLTQKGNTNVTIEDLSRKGDSDSQSAKASLTLLAPKLKFQVTSYIDNVNDDQSAVDFRVMTTAAAFPILTLLDEVTTWVPGDKLVLASTDYDWGQAEEATVVTCATCTKHQVQVEMDSRYTHFGEIISNVDQRGEVALLTRNVLIEGKMEDSCPPSNGNCHDFHYDTFGGHLKFVQGIANVHIEGVELVNMGQQTVIGHYPVHFHICHDLDGLGNYTNPPYFRYSTVHHSFSRCVTIHGTHGVTIVDNVCYDALGHAYFLEDGGEKRNVLDGNIGLTTRKGKILTSDSRPATYFVTNPKNHLRNNVAAGSEYYGFWYVFPDEPYGPSYGLGFMQLYESQHTPYAEWNNNVGHSNEVDGLFADSKVLPTTAAGGTSDYSPKIRPLDRNSPAAQVRIIKPTFYKNRFHNMWIRGGWITVEHGSFADSANGLAFAKSDDQAQFLQNSVIIGESKNIGEPTLYVDTAASTSIQFNRSIPVYTTPSTPIHGFLFHDGPVYLENVWFSGFKSNSYYLAGAIGFEKYNQNITSAVSSVKHIRFDFTDVTLGNRVLDSNSTLMGFPDDDRYNGITFRDTDGSVTGYSNSQIVKSRPFYITRGCYVRSNWQVAVCPDTFGKLTITFEDKQPDDTGPTVFAVRDDKPAVQEVQTNQNPAQFTTVLGGGYSYTLHWKDFVPRTFTIRGDGIEQGKWLRFGVCLPRHAKLDLSSTSPKYLENMNNWISVASLQELEADNIGDKYYWDTTAGLLFFKFVSFTTREANATTECGVQECPNVRIEVLSGDVTDRDCTSRAYDTFSYNRTEPNPTRPLHAQGLSASASSPGTYGAGPTRPFTTRSRVNGQFGEWGPWSDCSKSCEGGIQTRRRYCDHPIPQKGGTSCTGKAVETRDCTQQYCAVDGGWSAFGDWTACVKVTGCNGYQKRTRECNSPAPAHNGKYCEGQDEEVKSCTVC